MAKRQWSPLASRLRIVLAGLFLGTSWAGAAVAQGIAELYPGDQGIRDDSRVYLVEDFERPAAIDLQTDWPDYSHPENSSLVAEVPAASSGTKSLLMDGSQGSGHWYRNVEVGDQVFVRYYIKYDQGRHYHHTGLWLGGYDPPTPWPQGNAGGTEPPDTFFSVAPEVLEGVQTATGPFATFAFYNYWMGMSPDAGGVYWGENIFLGDQGQVPTNEWVCIEYMVRLNDPVSEKNGELALWIDGQKIIHFGDGYPNGNQNFGIWTPDPNGEPYKGLQWRDDPNWGINYLMLLNHPPGEFSGDQNGRIWIDDLVVASEYIGPLSAGDGEPPPEPPPDPPPTLSLAADAVVEGSEVVVNASVSGGTGPYQFLFDCGFDGGWDGTLETAEPSAEYRCASDGSFPLSIRVWAWDRTRDEVDDVVLQVEAPAPLPLGRPGQPMLIQ